MNMGDLVLKPKQPRLSQWQSAEMLSRKPWYPGNFNRAGHPPRPTYNYKPPEPASVWREVGPYAYHTPIYAPTILQPNKGKDYYFLAPYYRNAMPPPPNPNRLLMVDHSRARNIMRKPEVSPCHCRSKSMEDVRSEVFEVTDWEEDENGNRVENNNKFSKLYNRRSMENLLLDTAPSPKRKGSFQVCFYSNYNFLAQYLIYKALIIYYSSTCTFLFASLLTDFLIYRVA